jgi:hypothetical protein
MNDWKLIADFPADEQAKLRWLLRHAAENGIVEAGVACKFGRTWVINPQRLPDYLCKQTLATLGRSAA